jgi:hypothetical protein
MRIPLVLYLTLKTVFHTQLFEGMWLLKVGTLALYDSCQIGSGLTLTLIVVVCLVFSFCFLFLPFNPFSGSFFTALVCISLHNTDMLKGHHDLSKTHVPL